MRFVMVFLVILACLSPAGARGETIKTTGDARLDLKYVAHHDGDPHVLLATVTNTGREKIAYVTHESNLTFHGWKLVITGPGGEFAVPPPPGPAIINAPEHFMILKPRESVTRAYKISSALCCGPGRDTCRALASTPGTYQASLAYSFSPAMLPGHGGLSPAGTRPGWQKLVQELFFIQSMESKPVRFSIQKPGSR